MYVMLFQVVASCANYANLCKEMQSMAIKKKQKRERISIYPTKKLVRKFDEQKGAIPRSIIFYELMRMYADGEVKINLSKKIGDG